MNPTLIKTLFSMIHSLFAVMLISMYRSGGFQAAGTVYFVSNASMFFFCRIFMPERKCTCIILGGAAIFGGVTMVYGNPFFMQIYPSLKYIFCLLCLIYGSIFGKDMLKEIIETNIPNKNKETKYSGWMKFFSCLAILNEIIRRFLPMMTWIVFEGFIFNLIVAVFSIIQIGILQQIFNNKEPNWPNRMH